MGSGKVTSALRFEVSESEVGFLSAHPPTHQPVSLEKDIIFTELDCDLHIALAL
ncbi:hypothetical protein TIFTF001_011062 [Ficus carica]|uniref:Uncharacterized protein n=1 Tax=Ficus carica TaxID=3494 RepID=A0AA87ZZ74_FICCA|nr:hypothetical protein TIFTF001_011062 [Ficus carica]